MGGVAVNLRGVLYIERLEKVSPPSKANLYTHLYNVLKTYSLIH